MISDALYILFIWPIRLVMEFLFVLFMRIFDNPGTGIIFLSVAVNTISLPIYLIADRWQKEDRELQGRMKKKIDSIRSVFTGDERQMIINAYYRQMGYSPASILKTSAGLLMQIPFFIAAYSFLSQTTLLSGISFMFLRNLSAPDAILALPFPVFGMTALNIMPFIMTAINLLSSFIYAKKMGRRERLQLYAMAAIFLILLYNSASGLLLYWTTNNVYSLVKNMIQNFAKRTKNIPNIMAAIFALLIVFFIWSPLAGSNVSRYRPFFTVISLLLAITPSIWKKLVKLFSSEHDSGVLYFSAAITLFLILGFLNPAQVLSSSASDFDNPWLFMIRTFLQGFSFFFLVPLLIRTLAPVPVRRILTIAVAALAVNSLVCYFALTAYYGVADRNFRFNDTFYIINAFPLWVSVVVPLGSIAMVLLFSLKQKNKILAIFFQIVSGAIIILSTVNLVSAKKQYDHLRDLSIIKNESSIFFKISKTNQNVFIIFLDRLQGTAMSDALEYMPDLMNDLDGFTFYPNTLSFGSLTVTGVPSLLGGYDYTPLAINSRENELLVDKVNDAIKYMPEKFSMAGYRVVITDPVIANMQSVPDISIFNDMPNIESRLLSGRLTRRFMEEFPSGKEAGPVSFDYDILFRYGVFRLSPPLIRYYIYHEGRWWRESAFNNYDRAINEFSSLYYLSDICLIDEGNSTLNILMNATPHEGWVYNADLFPQNKPLEFSKEEINLYGSIEKTQYIYTLFSSFKQIIKWLDYLKSEGVYDNTRIIMVSDHGGQYKSERDNSEMESYNPVLMVKDFNERGILLISNAFMTNADTPYLAARDLTGISIDYNEAGILKNDVLVAVKEVSAQPSRHGPRKFNLIRRRVLTGRELLKIESWEEWENY